ncbi:MAG: hypothetical protein DDT34_00648 [Firmicutes bacterium]|nr:hypothetical protein [Bacillota bacterium]MBT9157596.1 hypothetical protein [Bacillota bacterium]
MAGKTIGGQAVMEGVLMRTPEGLAIAVRRTDQSISISKRPLASAVQRSRLFKLPVLRGAVALVDTLAIGLDALMHSVNESGDEELQLSKGALGLTVFAGLALAVGLFFLLPTILARFLGANLLHPVVANLAEGAIRMLIFVAYISLIARWPELRRFFQYHGAEHKTIACYEAGEELCLANVQKHSTLHLRCGTSFLLIVMVLSILFFSLFGWPNIYVRIVLRILLLPFVAGLAYEIIKISAKSTGAWWRALMWPGLLLQRLTTREPDEAQIEVAIAALKAALELPA